MEWVPDLRQLRAFLAVAEGTLVAIEMLGMNFLREWGDSHSHELLG